MTETFSIEHRRQRVGREALAWVQLLASGEATEQDAHALKAWRAANPGHDEAFVAASRLWRNVGVAAKRLEAEQTSVRARYPMTRRAFFATAAAASVGAYVAVRPPLGMWSSIPELLVTRHADLRTEPGEQRTVALNPSVQIQINTRSAVSMSGFSGGKPVELLVGESRLLADGFAADLVAGGGRIHLYRGEINVRHQDDSVCVTCVKGVAQVTVSSRTRNLSANQQLTYTDSEYSNIVPADIEIVTAWQRGLLVFRNRTLAEVADEMSRYRRAKIVVANQRLAQRQVSGTFHIDRLDSAVMQLKRLYDARVVELPGGVTILG